MYIFSLLNGLHMVNNIVNMEQTYIDYSEEWTLKEFRMDYIKSTLEYVGCTKFYICTIVYNILFAKCTIGFVHI